MNLKRYHRYRMNFTGKAANISALCMGASLFLQAIYYFLLRELSSIGVAEAIFSVVLPILLCILFIVLIRFAKIDAPGLFAILGAVVCLILMIGAFSSGNILRGVLGGVWYLLSALVLIGVAGGYLPGTLPASAMFAIALLVRLLAFDLRLRGIGSWIHEASSLMLLVGLTCLPSCFQVAKPRK